MEDDELGWKQLEKLPEKLKTAAYEAVDEVTSAKATEVANELIANTPVKSGTTRSSIKIEKVDKKTRGGGDVVGYKVVYDGYRDITPTGKNGRPNQVVASSLNRGWYLPNGKYVPGKYFIDKAVAKIKGMDDEISDKFDKKIDKIDLEEK